MSEPGWTPDTDGTPAEGTSAQPLTENGSSLTAEETADATPRPASRLRLTGSAGPASWLKRETRIGIAAVLSFLILVTALIVEKGRKGKPTSHEGGSPLMNIPKGPTGQASSSRPQPAEGSSGPAKVEQPPTPAPLPATRALADGSKPDDHVRPTRQQLLIARADGTDDPPPLATPPEPPAGEKATDAAESSASSTNDPKTSPQPDSIPDLPAPAPDTATPTPSDLPGGPAQPEVPLPSGSLESLPQPVKESNDPGAPKFGALPEIPQEPTTSGPGPDATPPRGTETTTTRPSEPAGRMPTPSAETAEPHLPESAPTAASPGSTNLIPGAGPAQAKVVPNFVSPPPVADPAPPAREGGQGNWITLPNATTRKTADDDPPTRNEPAVTAVERAPSRDPEPIDRVEPVPHVVQRGENFWTISRLYYGSGRYYMALWKANSRLVEKPEKLYVGMTIRIPPPEALDSALIERPRVETPAKPLRKTSRPVSRVDRDDSVGVGVGVETSTRRTTERELALPVVDPLTDRGSKMSRDSEPEPSSEVLYRPRRPLYRVRPRETLRGIARDTLGDSHRADEILELNRDIIKDPHALVAGQVLELPEDARLGKRAQ